MMTYSYTQISQYLTCPRRYRHRYLDGWQEKDVRAALLFGRCFEQAVAALFRHEDPAAVLFEQWAPCKNLDLVYSGNDTWDHMLRQGIQLLERFVQDGRVQIHQPMSHQQIRFTRSLSSSDSFVAFVDAVGELDSTPCVLEWKTSSARYPEEPDGIAALDAQLVCLSSALSPYYIWCRFEIPEFWEPLFLHSLVCNTQSGLAVFAVAVPDPGQGLRSQVDLVILSSVWENSEFEEMLEGPQGSSTHFVNRLSVGFDAVPRIAGCTSYLPFRMQQGRLEQMLRKSARHFFLLSLQQTPTSF
jgi:hypothetical protein